MRIGVIGVGNMGSKYACLIQDGKIPGLELSAITRVKEKERTLLSKSIEAGVPVFESADALFNAIENNTLKLDGVIIATPHYSHSELAIRAFKNNLHVLCDKPSGVFLRQANEMNRAAKEYDRVFAMVFNQRTNPIYIRMKEIVESGIYGNIKRVNWMVTDWYRPESYYTARPWRGTWKSDGGGVLLNQCPHNLDLIQWICGMPTSVQGFCHNGHFHDIEVEDDVTAYLEWENGATGVFVTSTGDAPGINRLEISLDEAMLVCENNELCIGLVEPVIGMKEAEYRKTSQEHFKRIEGQWQVEKIIPEEKPYERILNNFAEVIINQDNPESHTGLIADGKEGRNSLLLSNAIYLSSWSRSMIELPSEGSEEEEEFEKLFEAKMKELR